MQLYLGEIIYITILGIILFISLRKLLFNPIGKILQDREDLIEDAKDFVSKANSELEEKQKRWEEVMNDAATRAFDEHEKGRSEGFENRKEIIADSQDSAYKMINDARDEIQAKFLEVENDLKKEADKFAAEIAELLIGRKVKV